MNPYQNFIGATRNGNNLALIIPLLIAGSEFIYHTADSHDLSLQITIQNCVEPDFVVLHARITLPLSVSAFKRLK